MFPHLTALENVRIALQRKRGDNFDFWRSKRVARSRSTRARRELLDEVGPDATSRSKPAGEIPYGRKRALEIATTLALEPEMHAARRADGRAWATRTSTASSP